MTKEKLTARKEELLKTREQIIANFNIVAGLIQDCDYWLAELEKDVE